MKRTAFVLLALLVAACSTTQPPAPAPAPEQKAPEPAPAPAPAPAPQPQPMPQPESQEQAFRKAVAGLGGNNSVFFDFDKAVIKDDQVPVIAAQAKVASTYSNDSMTVQGNCDERGSREYNLALGQRRADAVKQRLLLLGIADSRIETISFGKEKPRATCHNESCWSKNRRADFVHEWK